MVKKVIACILMIIIVTGGIFCRPAYTSGIGEVEIPELISGYCDRVNRGDYLGLAELVDSVTADEYLSIFSNDENIRNNVGIMNVLSMEVKDICFCSAVDFEEYERGYDKEEYVNPQYLIVKTEMKVREEKEYFYKDGLNYLAVVIAGEDGTDKIFEMYLLDDAEGERYFTNMSGRAAGYDYSVACTDNLWKNPTYILVEMSRGGEIRRVDFKEYCRIVSANEHGYSSWSNEAHKACALAVKNYGWRRTLSPLKYSSEGFHVKAYGGDQSYNPGVAQANINAVSQAVNDIWNYVMLDSEYKLLTSYHLKEWQNSGIAYYAKQNGGVLSQYGARDLAGNGMGWSSILHYYYDTVSGKERYGNILPDGIISIMDLNHAAVYGVTVKYDSRQHWKICDTCKLPHVKTVHSMRAVGGGRYQCTGCRYTY